ncbi:unnamed protein product [Rotaria sordida]|uniref:RBR-type E3 ubiquitin transferase n=1 Tax=Rotaria sordida TaxID=392033 RepID=A0A814X8C8_9BILA|nr:unnamed protein product [Rotaria sordida]
MASAIAIDELDPNSQLLRNFDDAWRADLALIRQITLQEMQEEEDRILAARLAGITLDAIPDDVRDMAMLRHDSDNESNHEDEPKTVSNKPNVPNIGITYKQQKKTECALCMDYTIKTDPRVPCNHKYCISCLQELFMKSMQDETLMPPRCCQKQIPIDLARLTSKQIENFNAKQLEYSTKDRLYCSQPTCSTFIPPKLIVNSIGTCPKPGCRVTTCSICKAASHGKFDCPKDEATAAVLDTARKAGWTRCYQCQAMVELNHGCFHMTCRCHAEFCYVCAIPWKNCKCPQWDEERLYREARVRTARIPADQRTQTNNGIDLNEAIQRMANQLRANHECRHTNGWAYTRGGGRCEECGHFLPQYLFRCYHCHFMACNRCRRNRL